MATLSFRSSLLLEQLFRGVLEVVLVLRTCLINALWVLWLLPQSVGAWFGLSWEEWLEVSSSMG
jgi:hypothetical protein